MKIFCLRKCSTTLFLEIVEVDSKKTRESKSKIEKKKIFEFNGNGLWPYNFLILFQLVLSIL
jgi:hypothetical protein